MRRPRTERSDVFTGPRLAQGDRPATGMAMPLPDVPRAYLAWLVAAFLLGTGARDAGLLAGADRPSSVPRTPARHREVLTHSENRVLHYLPTNLSAREIAGELYLSVNTVKTHQRHLYAKLGARSRTQAVERARTFGLLPPAFVLGPGLHLPESARERIG